MTRRSLADITARADEFADDFENYDPKPGDRDAPLPPWRAASPLVPIASPTSRQDRCCSRAARTASASSFSATLRRQAASLTAIYGAPA